MQPLDERAATLFRRYRECKRKGSVRQAGSFLHNRRTAIERVRCQRHALILDAVGKFLTVEEIVHRNREPPGADVADDLRIGVAVRPEMLRVIVADVVIRDAEVRVASELRNSSRGCIDGSERSGTASR